MSANDKTLIDDYLSVADDVFDVVRSGYDTRFSAAQIFTFDLGNVFFDRIANAARAFAAATLEKHGLNMVGDDPFMGIRKHAEDLTNLTANGALMPRQEIEGNYELLHRSIVEMIDAHDGEAMFDVGQCPINLRFSMRERIERLVDHPYPSWKPHTDSWAGEPIDSINCIIPLYHDVDGINLEAMPATPETVANTLSPFPSYDEASKQIELLPPYDIDMAAGRGMFLDPRLVHRTLLDNLGDLRVSLDFRFRPRLSTHTALKERLDVAPGAKNVTYVDYTSWREIGRTRRYHTERAIADGAPPVAGCAGWKNHRYDDKFRSELRPS